MAQDEVVDYIREQRSQGHSDAAITERLQERWQDKVIENAFQAIGNDGLGMYRWVGSVALCLVVAGMGVLFNGMLLFVLTLPVALQTYSLLRDLRTIKGFYKRGALLVAVVTGFLCLEYFFLTDALGALIEIAPADIVGTVAVYAAVPSLLYWLEL